MLIIHGQLLQPCVDVYYVTLIFRGNDENECGYCKSCKSFTHLKKADESYLNGTVKNSNENVSENKILPKETLNY